MPKKEEKPKMKARERPRQMQKEAEAKLKAKRETNTTAEGGKPQVTAWCVRAHMSRGRVGSKGVRAQGRSSNH